MTIFDFVDIKLKEHALDIYKHEINNPVNYNININTFEPRILSGGVLEDIKDELLRLPIFRNTKRINIIHYPSYKAYLDNEDPVDINSVDPTRDVVNRQTQTFIISDENHEDDTILGEIVDIYSLQRPPVDSYNVESVKNRPGVWVYPTMFNEQDFTPYKKIEVTWSPEMEKDLQACRQTDNLSGNFKMELIKKFIDALDSKPNIPKANILMFRASPRSFAHMSKVSSESGS